MADLKAKLKVLGMGALHGVVDPLGKSLLDAGGPVPKQFFYGRAVPLVGGSAGALGGGYALGKHQGKKETEKKSMKMDRELAGAVLERWSSGEPVAETALYKMAEALGIDPQAALTEARFLTYVDSYLLEKRAMSGAERIVFSAAAGFDSRSMTKTASVHGLSPDELIIEALRERNFVPDLEKIASIGNAAHSASKKVGDWANSPSGSKFLGRVGKSVRGAGYVGGAMYAGKVVKDGLSGVADRVPQGVKDHALHGIGGASAKKHFSKEAMIPQQQPQPGGGQPPSGGPPPGMDPMADPGLQQAAGGAMMQPPQPGAVVQQQPSARMRPTPTAPEQIAPSDGGNIDELLAMSQQANPDAAAANGGLPPTGMPAPQAQQQDPMSRIMQVGPNLDQETASRYAEQLQRFEEGFGMQISDPKQMVKFVKELQKVDGKKVDQGIKAMGQQLEQEQAQELGIDGGVPTIDGGGGPQVLAPKPGAEGQQTPGGPGPQDQAPGQAEQPGGGGPGDPAQQVAKEMAAGGKPPGKQPPPPQKQGPQQAASEAAVEKVAHVARVLARAASSSAR